MLSNKRLISMSLLQQDHISFPRKLVNKIGPKFETKTIPTKQGPGIPGHKTKIRVRF